MSTTRSSPELTGSARDEHLRKLEALFSSDGSPSSAPAQPLSRPSNHGSNGGERVFSSPRKSLGRAPSEYRMRLERLRAAREPDAIREAADAFLAFHQLPDDMDVLYKLFQHPDEKVVREALGQISSLLMQGRLTGSLLLADRLKALAERAKDPATHSFIDGVRAQLAKTKSKT